VSEDAINRCPQFACNDEKERASLDEKFRFSRWGGKLLPKHPSNFALIILSSASKFSSSGMNAKTAFVRLCIAETPVALDALDETLPASLAESTVCVVLIRAAAASREALLRGSFKSRFRFSSFLSKSGSSHTPKPVSLLELKRRFRSSGQRH
jgi:hypothetical protein